MSMLRNTTKCDKGVISEIRKQELFCDNCNPIHNPLVEYEQILSAKKLNKAFDLLFEEMKKNNFL